MVHARVVCLREQVDEGDELGPGRVLREARRMPRGEVLDAALKDAEWDGATEEPGPAGFRDGPGGHGLTDDEEAWVRGVVAGWSEDSGREVAWAATVHEETLVVMRSGWHLHAVVGLRSGRVLGWAKKPSWRTHASRVAIGAPIVAYAAVRALSRTGVDGMVTIGSLALVVALLVMAFAWPKTHPVPPPQDV